MVCVGGEIGPCSGFLAFPKPAKLSGVMGNQSVVGVTKGGWGLILLPQPLFVPCVLVGFSETLQHLVLAPAVSESC